MPSDEQLIGFALDVSGSMANSIQNASGGTQSRLDSIRQALDTLLAEAERLTAAGNGRQGESSLSFFAYAFGLRGPAEYCDLFRLLEAKESLKELSNTDASQLPRNYRIIAERIAKELGQEFERRLRHDERAVAIEVMGHSARRLLSISRERAELELSKAVEQHIRSKVADALLGEILREDLTLSLRDLRGRWDALRNGVSMSNDMLGGGTPMDAALREIGKRFERERSIRSNVSCTLFIVSDGDSTDGDPRVPARTIADAGVRIVSCYVSSNNVVEAKRLLRKSQHTWSDGARAMFDIATLLPPSGPEAEYLARMGWSTPAGARMFAQINQSDLLSEFMNVVIAPIRAEHGFDSVGAVGRSPAN